MNSRVSLGAKAYFVFVLFVLLGQGVHGQSTVPSDFAGTWRLNLEKSKLPTPIQSETLVIKCKGDVIEMHRMTDGRKADYSFKADGQQRTSFANPEHREEYRATLSGTVLTVETTYSRKETREPWSTATVSPSPTRRWEVTNNGRNLVFKGTGKNDAPVTKVYDRAEP